MASSEIESQRQQNRGSDNRRNKYNDALKHFLPFRPKPKDKEELPERSAGLVNYISFHWLTPLMWKAYKRDLNTDDIWKLPKMDGAEVNSLRLERFWEEELAYAKANSKEPRLWRCVVRFIRTRIIVALVIITLLTVVHFLGPSVLLKMALDYISEPEVNNLYAAGVVLALATTNLCFMATLNSANFSVGLITGTRVIGAVQALIYKKILRLKSGGEGLSAQVVNFVSNDMERVFVSILYSVFIIMPPLMFIVTSIYSIYVVGPWAVMGQAVYLLFYPIMGGIAKLQTRIREQTVRVTDRRVSFMNEILNNIKLIKMYSWEDAFAETIAGLRKEELKKHRKGALAAAVGSSLTPSIGVLSTITTLLGYTLAGHELTAVNAFLIFSLFTNLQVSIDILPYTIRDIAETKVALGRIQKLLLLPEYQEPTRIKSGSSKMLQLQYACFAWEAFQIDTQGKKRSDDLKDGNVTKDKSNEDGEVKGSLLLQDGQTPANSSTDSVYNSNDSYVSKSIKTLFDINFSTDRGKLIGVCGSIGSGKSSLISAICGDMKKLKGVMEVNGSVALVTQVPWIYNDSLRENLLLGEDYDEERYQTVIKSCCLESDLRHMPKGDMTEIGERGINLSGGQKQRVNLGRAVYSNRDIYLLDDPLSAVDTQVARDIFNNCIRRVLRDKTVIFVTHATHFLERCDEIILMHEGRIAEHGTHAELMAHQKDYYTMITNGTYGNESENQKPTLKRTTSVSSAKSAPDDDTKETSDGKLISEEKKASGSISSKVYLTFMKVCGGCPAVSIIILAVLVFTLSRMFSPVWLQIWMDQGDGKVEERRMNMTKYNLTYSDEELTGNVILNPQVELFQIVYGLSFFIMVGTGVIKGVSITFSILAGSSKLHNGMFKSILRSPMKFFDTTPTGRILARFSRDLDEMDVRIPLYFELVFQGVLFALGQFCLASYIYIWFVIPLVGLTGFFLVVDVFLKAGVRELKRIDNTLKSPVLQHIGSTLTGLSVIRTFDKQEVFIHRMYKYLDNHSAAYLLFKVANRWYVFRSDVLAASINVSITAICVFTKGVVSTATAALALTAIGPVCDHFPYLMRLKSELQGRITSVERLAEYAYELTSEAPREIPSTKPPAEWPSGGALELKDVKLRYRPELPLILHGITASIKPGEKIGIVGRTGAGKSSLISTLLRLTELEEGHVLIDDVDISAIGLHTLRSAISVIPQDPVLFQGSIRYNLDPFNNHSDDMVWQALEQSHLKAIIQQQEYGLASAVAAGGENFSVGERQLICLTRALLRNSKILLLDEATASVDMETDQLIQSTIREAFVDSTVITIAHRLNTIATYDRVMVLEAGRIAEFDAPETLMEMDGSRFRHMMAAMGITSVEQMRHLA